MMNEKYILYLLLSWYVLYNKIPQYLFFYVLKYYNTNKNNYFFDLLVKTIYGQKKTNEIENNKSNENNQDCQKSILKYEDKYLEDIRKLNKDWQFTEEELEYENNFANRYYGISKHELNKRLEIIEAKIQNKEKDIQEIREKMDNDEYEKIDNHKNSEEDEYEEDEDEKVIMDEERIKYILDGFNNELNILKDEFRDVMDQISTEEGLEKLKNSALNSARHFIINKRIEKLKNCYVMEKTPLGNVLMIYDMDKSSFKYYSDSTIPYRYLETVGRKYVKFFNCRPLFVDMEEELRLFEMKWEKQNKEKEKNEFVENINVECETKEIDKKKNVFTKFKSYNKEGGSGRVNFVAQPKNNISNVKTETKENEKIILKEKANRYTYEGKIANFNFLKKVEKTVCNKKLGLTFADFKKITKKTA